MIHRCCLLALLLAGCAGPMATASGPSSPSDAASVAGSASPPASIVDASTPASAPPLPDRFPVHASMDAQDAPAGLTARWTTDASPPDVYDFYLGALADAGYVIDLEAPGGAAAIIRFHDADGTAYQLNFFGSGPLTVELGAHRE